MDVVASCATAQFVAAIHAVTHNNASGDRTIGLTFYIGHLTLTVVLVVLWLSVGHVIERSLVRLPAGALSSQLGQLSLPSLRGR